MQAGQRFPQFVPQCPQPLPREEKTAVIELRHSRGAQKIMSVTGTARSDEDDHVRYIARPGLKDLFPALGAISWP